MKIKLKLYDTLTRRKEAFRPLRKNRAGLYTCGPTVYNYAHIGNLRTYVFEDILRRTLEYAGYRVRHVMNITDVGHLTSDADEGEDKMEREAEKEKRSVWDIARFYTDAFLKDIARLNIKKAHVLSPATKNIREQISLIERLFKKGLAYETSQAVYFDVSRFPGYTKLSRQKLSAKKTRAREEVAADPEKRQAQDFALWFKRVGKFSNHTMRWPSPWGDGFPGWHIECSAISTKYLGQPFDIHTGGTDHITVHHANEIAQSEGAYGTPLARIWMHGEFLLISGSKMAKSAGGFYTLDALAEKGFSPIAFRYLVLTAHYRSQMNFTWESLSAAQRSLERLSNFVRSLHETKSYIPKYRDRIPVSGIRSLEKYSMAFERGVSDDLNMPKVLAVVWELVTAYNKNPDAFSVKSMRAALNDFDRVLGLGLKNMKKKAVPARVKTLVAARESARRKRDWEKADALREKIKSLGYLVKDTPEGAEINKL
ncbi:MAG: cysteine--tRNA ligase [Patescibacteria group bacterium]